jgi:hypothetical protein
MTFDFSWAALLAAFGGGVFAAAIGTLPAFIFTGFAVLAGVAAAAAGGGTGILDHIAFGPFLGPHIAFGGGVAAVAYAHRKGLLPTARDITPPLMGLGRPDVLAVGGLFGAIGYVIERGFQSLGLGPWTDAIALTVVVSAILVRLAYGSTGLFGEPGKNGKRFRPDDAACWLRWQERPGQILMIGLGAGIPSAYVALLLGAPAGGVAGFGIAAASLIFAQMGGQTPVTHHIALPAAVAALASGSLVVGIVFGVVGAFAGEFFARLFLIHGDTHIDPPAAAIAFSVLLLRLVEHGGVL